MGRLFFKMLEPHLRESMREEISKNLLHNRKMQESLNYRLDAVNLEYSFGDARRCEDGFEMMRFAVETAQKNNTHGLWLEFGVFKGESINFIAKLIPEKNIFGFDSFVGLPEVWKRGRRPMQEGTFDLKGQLPVCEKNVSLVKGWFQDTWPEFTAQHAEPAAFVHIDSDLYSSAKTVLDQLSVQEGTVIVFDEYYNYENWKQGEHQAFQEFLAQRKLKAECIAFCPTRSAKTVFVVRGSADSQYRAPSLNFKSSKGI